MLNVLFNSICRVAFPWKNDSLIASIHEVEPLFSLKPKLMSKLIPIDCRFEKAKPILSLGPCEKMMINERLS